MSTWRMNHKGFLLTSYPYSFSNSAYFESLQEERQSAFRRLFLKNGCRIDISIFGADCASMGMQ